MENLAEVSGALPSQVPLPDIAGVTPVDLTTELGKLSGDLASGEYVSPVDAQAAATELERADTARQEELAAIAEPHRRSQTAWHARKQATLTNLPR